MLIRRFVELLTPQQCLRCGVDNAILCGSCLLDCGLDKPQVCFRCGMGSSGGLTCASCLVVTSLAGVAVGAYYDEAVKELIWQLKFKRLRGSVEAAAELVLGALPEEPRVDVVTGVPVSPARYRERGYSQAELLARRVATRLGLPYAPLLGRVNSAHQIGRDRATRLAQVEGVFYPLRKLRGQRALVIDDVVTTGATLGECAETLKLAGAGEVWGAAVARH